MNDTTFFPVLTRMQEDGHWQRQFLLQPQAVLHHLNIPILENLNFPKKVSDSQTEQQLLHLLNQNLPVSTPAADIDIGLHWWGVLIHWSTEFTEQYINNGVKLINMQQALLQASKAASLHSMDDTLAKAFAMAFMAKSVDIRLTNRQHGVQWPITWLQMAAIVNQPSVITALKYIHPLANH